MKNHSRDLEYLAILRSHTAADYERSVMMASKRKPLAILFIGNSHTYVKDGYMITPRGYKV